MASFKDLLQERASSLFANTDQAPHEQPPIIYESIQRDQQQIRLMKIHPSDDQTSPIECTLYTVALNDDLKFTALSYVWGDPSITTGITVNQQPMQVTTNLASVLRHIRATAVCPVMAAFWADAICINQADILEKNHQVRLMATLYQTASLVLSWMGPEPSGKSIALQFLYQIANRRDDLQRLKESSSERFFDLLQSFINGIDEESALESMDVLTSNGLFSRGWVVQESYLAKSRLMVRGQEAIDAQDLAGSVQLLSDLNLAAMPEFFNKLSRCADRMYVMSTSPFSYKKALNGGTPTVASLLVLTQHFQVTDPRDKVYCLLGMARETIDVDYGSPAQDVYCSTMREYANRTSTLHLLDFAGLESHAPDGVEHAVPNLPSWVPDWHFLSHNKDKNRLITQNRTASKKPHAQLTPVTLLNHLAVAGVRLDIGSWSKQSPIRFVAAAEISTGFPFVTALWTYALKDDHKHPASGTPRLRALFDAALSQDGKKHHVASLDDKEYILQGASFVYFCYLVQTADDALMKNVVGSSLSDSREPPTWFKSFFAKHFVGREDISLDVLSGFETGSPRPNKMAGAALLMGLQDLYFFTTESGYFGFCGFRIGNEDIICLIRGSFNLAVLRKSGSHFLLVGMCWVYGFMDGEAEENLDDSQLEVFEIH
ncbi:heterokaryon incompatibility protein-domain-containing protein [Podospora didyma]|uniref:Heterokaryon incompatibility protein-domain-containing protein n=1 Tax=Podospora didyma TaxID=330526 RepID=A0AAE0NQN0_9PEZI|nr:heterokaryon incompatibility protein-domain-containing protein [Podospora didyma]